MSKKSDLPQGTLDLLILKVTALGSLHGYAVAQRLQQVSRDVVQVPQGSLYPALHRLENLGAISGMPSVNTGALPASPFAALLAISLGIGATTAVFSVSDCNLFRSLPYGSDDRLVSFGMLVKVVDDGEFLFAADYRDLAPANTPFAAITSWSDVRDCDITEPNPIRQHCADVGSNFLSVFGIHSVLGDTFSKFDTEPGAPAKVILRYGMWQSHFAGDSRIIDKTPTLDGASARIVGVLPRSFELPTFEHADLLTPQIILPVGWQHGATRVLRTIGRLKPGITLNAATARSEQSKLIGRIRST